METLLGDPTDYDAEQILILIAVAAMREQHRREQAAEQECPKCTARG